jgi:hypothetical protein
MDSGGSSAHPRSRRACDVQLYGHLGHGLGDRGDTADHRVGMSILENDAPLTRMLDQSELLHLLTHLVLVPAQHARRVRERVAVVEGVSEVLQSLFRNRTCPSVRPSVSPETRTSPARE